MGASLMPVIVDAGDDSPQIPACRPGQGRTLPPGAAVPGADVNGTGERCDRFRMVPVPWGWRWMGGSRLSGTSSFRSWDDRHDEVRAQVAQNHWWTTKWHGPRL